MRCLFIAIFMLNFSVSAISQEQTANFPDDYFGIYKGNLHISSEQGNQNIPMEFHLLATDTLGKYIYTLVYGEGETKQLRAYNLLEKDQEKGHYVVDEHNGIILDANVINNRMYTLFEVNDTLLTTFITFETAYMIFEIVTTPKSKKRVTYAEDEDKIEVISYPITTIQRALLQKQ